MWSRQGQAYLLRVAMILTDHVIYMAAEHIDKKIKPAFTHWLIARSTL